MATTGAWGAELLQSEKESLVAEIASLSQQSDDCQTQIVVLQGRLADVDALLDGSVTVAAAIAAEG